MSNLYGNDVLVEVDEIHRHALAVIGILSDSLESPHQIEEEKINEVCSLLTNMLTEANKKLDEVPENTGEQAS